VVRLVLPDEATPILLDVLLGRTTKTYVLHEDEPGRDTALKLAGRMLGAKPALRDAGESPSRDTPALVFGSPDQISGCISSLGFPERPAKIAGNGTGRAWVARRTDGKAILFVEADGPEALQGLIRPLPHYRSKSFVVFDGSRAIDKGVWPSAGGPLSKELD